ncbi:c-type cytochrome [Blastopirellula marina]|uniref:Probable Methylamine utilization protein mauG n=1 Tax=Blastopirellula marina DSM 3645 TaxID=314230 RepID=A3ZS01_9BACT|nr:c-type cytochrome [Blastopirellula marina]EAQ80923.1 probable Methylamine utilization protein mauG [Blastopirellula marina DSM 3645]
MFGLATISLLVVSAVIGANSLDLQRADLRQPQRLALSHAGDRLLTANQKSGSVSLIDLTTHKTIGEFRVGQSVTSLTTLPGDHFLLTDPIAHEVIEIALIDDQITVVEQIPVPAYPQRTAATLDGDVIYVSSLWPKQMTRLEKQANQWRETKRLTLPFAPRELLLLPERNVLIVADAFAGNLAALSTGDFEVQAINQFPAHNIQRMQPADDGESVALAHQMLSELAFTNENDIHWGMVMSNDIRWLAVDALVKQDADLYEGNRMHSIGEPGRGSGDPTSIAIATTDDYAVSMGATNQIAIGKDHAYGIWRVKVGQRPTDVIFSADQKLVYVADSLDDTISIVNVKRRQRIGTISLGPQRERTPEEKGEAIFYRGLSMEGWMSCHSCHTDGHANGLANDNLSDESYGAPKRVLSLLSQSDTAPYGWLGKSDTLQVQIHKSITQTMQGEDISAVEANHLASFLETLALPPPIDELQQTRDDAQVAAGKALFTELSCVGCHAPPTYTTPDVYDVGMHDKKGNEAFNPPSLRGVGHRGPYFHDRRCETLEEVIVGQKHQQPRDLSDNEQAALIAFLRSL